MGDIERYDGRYTLWADFIELQGEPTETADTPMVAESEYVKLHDQFAGAVVSAYEQGFLDGVEAARVAATHAVMPEDFIERARDAGGQ